MSRDDDYAQFLVDYTEPPEHDTNYDLRGVRPRTTGWYVYDDGYWTGPYDDEAEANAAVVNPTTVERFAADAVICLVTRA